MSSASFDAEDFNYRENRQNQPDRESGRRPMFAVRDVLFASRDSRRHPRSFNRPLRVQPPPPPPCTPSVILLLTDVTPGTPLATSAAC